MDSIRIKNLRSLRDTGKIKLKPLTILVGKNSSGKSTFLRFFPLMKQTLMTKRNEPILWYEKDYVDFGSFHESINRGVDSDESILFEFKFNSFIDPDYRESKIPVTVSIEFNENSYKSIKIALANNLYIEMKTRKDRPHLSLYINGKAQDASVIVFNADNQSLIPNMRILKENRTAKEEELNIVPLLSFQTYFREKLRLLFDKHRQSYFLFEDYFNESHALNTVQGDFDSVIEEVEKLFHYLLHDGVEDLEEIELIESRETQFLNFLKKEPPNIKKEIGNFFVLSLWENILDNINEEIATNFKNVHYIAPLRASAQRYYRIQGLSVSEIDSQGENIPMMLNHMSYRETTQFKKWVYENFEFEISTAISSGHISLQISFDKINYLNLADTGFGYSQILPIIVLMWKVINSVEELSTNRRVSKDDSYDKKVENKNFYVIIEQPELHLHPAMQAELTDLFINCINVAKQNNIELKIIIETHSEIIVNRVGKKIFQDEISEQDVNLLMFGDNEKNNHIDTKIESVKYNADGILEGWPIGFFYPED